MSELEINFLLNFKSVNLSLTKALSTFDNLDSKEKAKK